MENQLIRFIDEQMAPTLKGIKEAAEENRKQIKKLLETATEAQVRLAELIKQLHD
jgi:uncharacterized protein YggL (DUF469 family)